MEETRRAWIRIGLAEGLGPRTWIPLLEHLGGAAALAGASVRTLAPALGQARARSLVDALARVEPEAIVADASELEQTVATPADADWPASRLEGLPDPPAVLFRQGPFPGPAQPSVAIVGTREASRYGLETARGFAGDLAGRGVLVVSGFAMGIDTAAHAGALAGAGTTLAVLGAGLDVPYPVANAGLRVELLAAGSTLLSEYPPGTEAQRFHFPRRNRLVAAFADLVLVVEAPERSGALITAALANELGRTVLAVPGHIRRRTQVGCHRLIQQGAGLCGSLDDLLEPLALGAFSSASPGAARGEPDAGPELDLWQQLDLDEAQDIDTLAQRTGLSAGVLLAALAGLEISGFALRIPGAGYVRR